MALEIFKLVGSIFVDSDAAEKSLQKTDKKALGVGESLGKGIKTAAKWGAGLVAAAGAVGGALIKASKDEAAALDVIDKGSQRMKISAESYQELAYAAGLSGVEMGTLEKAAKKLEGTDLSFDEALSQIMSIGDESERTQAAIEMFGEGIAYQMTPLLAAGADGMESMKKEAHDLGLVMSKDTVKSGAEMNDMFSKVEQSVGTLKAGIMQEFMPVIMMLLSWVVDNMPVIRNTVSNVIAEIRPFILGLIPIIQSVFQLAGTLWNSTLKPVLTGITNFISGVFSGDWKKAWTGVKDIFSGIANGLAVIFKEPINWIISGINKFITGINNIKIPSWVPGVGGKGFSISQIPMLAEGGEIRTRGTVLVGERGPEFLDLPAGARVTPLNKAGTGIDYDRLTVAIVAALMEILPELREIIQIVPDDRGIFRVVRQQAREFEARTGQPAFAQ